MQQPGEQGSILVAARFRVFFRDDAIRSLCRSVSLTKPTKLEPKSAGVRMRRAYYDCSYGQLHVRTAFPATGGFDERTTLVCLHGSEGSSRSFARLLPEIAVDRSVYAPDLPGFGESDAAPGGHAADAARAVADLARDLRLRQIDILGVGFGAAVALSLAGAAPELVRRLVLMRIPTLDALPDARSARAALPRARWIELGGDAADSMDTAPGVVAREISAFLGE
jgi:pimeloyl-ACP methyl ester carboxylesterase